MEEILEEIAKARKKLPHRFGYARKVVDNLANNGVIVSPQMVYRVAGGLKKVSDFSENDVAIARQIIDLGNKLENDKKSLLGEKKYGRATSLKSKTV